MVVPTTKILDRDDSLDLNNKRSAVRSLNITIVVVINDERQMDEYRFALDTVRCYSFMHNYPFRIVKGDEYQHCRHQDMMFRRHCVVAEVLQTTDWVLFIDADIGVVNPTRADIRVNLCSGNNSEKSEDRLDVIHGSAGCMSLLAWATFICNSYYGINRLIEEYVDTRFDITFYDRFCSWEVAMGSYIVKNTKFSRTFLMNFANFERQLPDSFHGSDNGAIHEKFVFASVETKSTYNSVCVARSTGDFNQEKRLRRKLRRQLQQDRDNEWTSRAMEFEKAWEDRNPRKAYALLKQYSGKMKRCSHVLNTANGVAVGEATLPIWKEHFKTLLNRLTPSAPELEHVHRPTYAVNEEPPTVSEVLVCIQKMKNGKSGGDDGISAKMLKYLPPSGIREMTEIIRSIWIDERIPDSWRHAIIIPLHKKLSVTDPRNYRGISLLRVMYKVLERIILDRLIKHREETTRDEQAGFRPGRSTIDQVFIVRRVIKIWQRYSKPMQLAFLDFEAAFDSPHRGRLLNALSADGVPGKFVRLLDDMNQ
ncbi:hypothetical protein RB195_006600 [Necator americanus]|uniref:Reverse transcriptase domain-containing protein n=1 Tax=Necator americanus TaxID=51031 RepID=A0ABR1BTE4_NECAM